METTRNRSLRVSPVPQQLPVAGGSPTASRVHRSWLGSSAAVARPSELALQSRSELLLGRRPFWLGRRSRMGCGISSRTAWDLEPTTPRQVGSSGLGRKVRLRPDEDEESDLDQDATLPKQVMGRDLSTFMRDTAPRDHQFFAQERGALKPAWSKRVQREWRILARGLPDNIQLRLYGDRLDIMRAAMIGPENTPYADALLFFDIHLSPNYPLVPPTLKFWSFGERMNPNLYESGLVCLSLLGTWSGSGSEVWCSRKSTVLQVLVSILGLVLVEEPYYNEPGYERTRGSPQAELQARHYSEKARLMSLRSMLRICQTPPGGFEDYTRQHMAEKLEKLLQRLEQFVVTPVSTGPVPAVSSGDTVAVQPAAQPAAHPVALVPRRSGIKVDGIDTGSASEGFRRDLARLIPSLKGVHKRMAAEHQAALAAAVAAADAAGGEAANTAAGDDASRSSKSPPSSASAPSLPAAPGAAPGNLLGAKRTVPAMRLEGVEQDIGVVQLGVGKGKSRAAIDLSRRPQQIMNSFVAAGA